MVIEKPDWVEEDDEGKVWRIDDFEHESTLNDLQALECYCCPWCQSWICNPTYIAAGNPCIGDGCEF